MKKNSQAKSFKRRHLDPFTRAAKIALLERNETVAELARRIRYPRNTVSRVINHPTLHPAVRELISSDLKLEVLA